MELSPVMEVTIYGLLAGVVGTGLGGVFAYLLPKPKPVTFSAVLGFAAGVMLAVIFLELLQKSLEDSGRVASIIGVALGMVGFLFLDSLLPHQHPVKDEHGRGKGNSGYLKMGLLLSIGIAIHNLPEGLAIGAGYAASEQMGMTLALILGIHNIPEGLAVALPMKAAGKAGRGVAASFLAGIPMGLGALVGGLIGNISPLFLSIALSFAAGGMLYIVCDELIPDAFEASSGHVPIMGVGVGVVLGLILTAL